MKAGCVIIGMILLFIGLIVTLVIGEFGYAAGLGFSLIVSIIWSIISYGNRKG